MATILQYRQLGQQLENQLETIRDDSRNLLCISSTEEVNGQPVFVVGWDGHDDPQNPQNWTSRQKWVAVCLVTSLSGLVGACAPIDSPVIQSAAKEFGVSEVVESLAVGIFLVGFGSGALVAGPVSEVLGRSRTYLFSLGSMCIWLMAAALAPNIGAQLVFRYLAGFSGASPLVCAGGTVSDMFTPLEKTYVFPFFSIVGFLGPALGPVMSAWIPDSRLHTWRWSEWVALLFAGLVFALLLVFQPETYEPVLLSWKAKNLRRLTGDGRYLAYHEIHQVSMYESLKIALSRPFVLAWYEPVIQLGALYLCIIYIVLFTFFDGYTVIFQETYHLSIGMTHTLFVGIAIGVLSSFPLVPIVYKKTVKAELNARKNGKATFEPEIRLWFGMLGAPAIPISLFWMAWTAYPSISLWSPLLASVVFGYGFITIFICVYMYLIDTYQLYAASGLTFNTLLRYTASGGMTVVGIPFYRNLGAHWTLTILGCISLVLTPIPYVFYKYGHKIREKSRFACVHQSLQGTNQEKVLKEKDDGNAA